MAAAAGTWAFSLPALRKMRELLLRGADATDCVQEAMAGEGRPRAAALRG